MEDVMNKQERRDYIAAIAQRMQAEKIRERELYQIDVEVTRPEDIMSIENIDGLVMTGLQKIAGGFRKLPVIIL